MCHLQLDEEELYSSVARGAPDEDASARPADAANYVTFGTDAGSDTSNKPTSSSGHEAADGVRKPAWGNAGAGVAVVSGRSDIVCNLFWFSALYEQYGP